MKRIIYLLLISGIAFLSACNDDENKPGNPVMGVKTQFESAMFGDSLSFTINTIDTEVPLSTLKAYLFYSDEIVSEVVIRTKTNADYSGKIFVPFYPNVPNGTATLKFVLQNIHFTITEKEYDLPLTRPDFPYLTFVTPDEDYRMERVGLYKYELTEVFPAKMPGYIKAPVAGENGNEITFGWENNTITQGTDNNITFSNIPGEYTISFNTFNYEASPFIIPSINGKEMQQVDDNNFRLDMTIAQGDELVIENIPGFENWWIDQDFFTKKDEKTLVFVPIAGSYRVTANFEHEYLIVEALRDGQLASLQSDGTGAIWIIGTGTGKPSLSNEVGWDPGKALCMAPTGSKKYQITVTAGQTINASSINFKFFHQKGWGGEYTNAALSTSSDIVFIGTGDNGRDRGNLGLVNDTPLETGATYVFTVDLSNGNDNAVLTVDKK